MLHLQHPGANACCSVKMIIRSHGNIQNFCFVFTVFQAAKLVFQLRQKWHSMFLRRMRSPAKPLSQQDEATICALVSVCLPTEPPCSIVWVDLNVESEASQTLCAGGETEPIFLHLRSSQQRSKRWACSSQLALVSGPCPCRLRALRRHPPGGVVAVEPLYPSKRPLRLLSVLQMLSCVYVYLKAHQGNIKGPMAWRFHFRFTFLTLMSSPSLPMVPQWLKMTLGVKRAVGILLRLRKKESSICTDITYVHT